MPHKAGRLFFERKRRWSERKDLILDHYLVPYLSKISSQRKPILLIDGFAGPGQFDDGKPGSPVIIAKNAELTRRKNLRHQVPIKSLFIEADDDLAARLEQRVGQFQNATVRHSRFLDVVSEIEQAAHTHSVFLYLDPYTPDGLEWQELDRIFQFVATGQHSVEVLMNFNADAFCRRGLAALKDAGTAVSTEDQAEDLSARGVVGLDRLDAIVGGDWWRALLAGPEEYPEKARLVVTRFCEQLRQRFDEVCVHEIKAQWKDKVPKYVLVFGSRHPDTRELMNDAMCRSREVLADETSVEESTLFEMRDEELVPDPNQLRQLIIEQLSEAMPRKRLLWLVIGRRFGAFHSGEIKRMVNALRKEGIVQSDHSGPRLNDHALVWPKGKM